MKRIYPLLAGLLALTTVCFVPVPGRSAETAQARMWCLSLHFQQGSDGFGDTLDLSTISSTPNGELEPYNGLEYISGFALDSSVFPITGTIYVNLPPFVDADNDGWPDFFQVSQGAGGTTSGTYATAIGGGTVTATWNRPAGSKDGTCVLSLVDNTYGPGRFPAQF
jgi:hypothetical protein